MRQFQFFLILLACFFSIHPGAMAQEKTIHGFVTTFDSIPLIGADIRIKSTKQEIKTDTLGRFFAFVQPKDKLRVSAKGFFTQNVKLDDNVKLVMINLKLRPTEGAREYAIGYGYVKDAEKLNAVAQLSNKDMDFSTYTSMYDVIRGRFGGVHIDSNGDIIIRGINSINLSSAALIIIDGIPSSSSTFAQITPSTVKSINIIKDGSAAIYGARGANGVVIVETKRGGDD